MEPVSLSLRRESRDAPSKTPLSIVTFLVGVVFLLILPHRDTINVGWDGRIFDCDFNQQLELGMGTAGTNAGASGKLRAVQVGTAAVLF